MKEDINIERGKTWTNGTSRRHSNLFCLTCSLRCSKRCTIESSMQFVSSIKSSPSASGKQEKLYTSQENSSTECGQPNTKARSTGCCYHIFNIPLALSKRKKIIYYILPPKNSPPCLFSGGFLFGHLFEQGRLDVSMLVLTKLEESLSQVTRIFQYDTAKEMSEKWVLYQQSEIKLKRNR